MIGVQLDENDEKAKKAETFANGILDVTVSMFKSKLKRNRKKNSQSEVSEHQNVPEINVTNEQLGSNLGTNLGSPTLHSVANVAKSLMVVDEVFQRKGSRKFGSFKRKNEKKIEQKRKGSFKRLSERILKKENK